jgi:ubiquinone/menaquinone biosynthesis C-methylase UbiE
MKSSGSQPDPLTHGTEVGAAIYSPLALKLYDLWVLGFSNRWAWECPTQSILLPFYRKHIGQNHLEVGAGTGFYPANACARANQRISLLDLNPNTLNTASRRIGKAVVKTHMADILAPLPTLEGQGFDSISLFYLLHCLPGDMTHKSKAFASLKSWLKPDGILFGATILGDDASHNWVGRRLMKLYNRKGVFGNRADTEESLRNGLEGHFERVEVRRHGKVALFSAKQARR